MSINAVKGTTRVSNNDRKLMKDLWVAGKDNPLEKNRLKRKLTHTEKEARQAMPEERAEQAFKSLRKKQKTFVAKKEALPIDDAIAVQCIQGVGWTDFCRRYDACAQTMGATKQFESALRAFKKSKHKRQQSGSSNDANNSDANNSDANNSDANNSSANSNVHLKTLNIALRWMQKITATPIAPTTQSGGGNPANSRTLRFLGDFKNKRFHNFRVKCEQHEQKVARTLTDRQLKSQANRLFAQQWRQKTKQEKCERVCVQLEFANDYESLRHPSIAIRCDCCGDLIPSLEAVTADFKLFFHKNCAVVNESATKMPHNFDIFDIAHK